MLENVLVPSRSVVTPTKKCFNQISCQFLTESHIQSPSVITTTEIDHKKGPTKKLFIKGHRKLQSMTAINSTNASGGRMDKESPTYKLSWLHKYASASDQLLKVPSVKQSPKAAKECISKRSLKTTLLPKVVYSQTLTAKSPSVRKYVQRSDGVNV